MEYNFNQFVFTHVKADQKEVVQELIENDEIYTEFQDQLLISAHPALQQVYNGCTANDALKAAVAGEDLKLYQAIRRAYDYPDYYIEYQDIANELNLGFECFSRYWLVSNQLASMLSEEREPVIRYYSQSWWATNEFSIDSKTLKHLFSKMTLSLNPPTDAPATLNAVVVPVPRVSVKVVQ
jgi:hypothetical protein